MTSIILSSMSSWSDIWMSALTNPSVDTYERIIDDPEANNRRAYTWMLSSVTVLILVFLALAVLRIPTHITPFRGLALGKGGSFPISLGCGLPIALVVAAIAFTIEVALLNFFASLFGTPSKGSSERLSYLLAAIQSPLAFAYLVFFIVPDSPLTTVLGLIVLAYHVYTVGLALQAVYEFTWHRAAIVLLSNMTVIAGIVVLFKFITQR